MSKNQAPSSPAHPSSTLPSSQTSDGAVSKHAGQPGALTALRIDYSTRDKAFAPHAPTSTLGKIRSEVKALSSGPRLGDKPLWSVSNSTSPLTGIGYEGGPVGSVHFAPPPSSLTTSVPGLPQRPLMSQNSAYQAVKFVYNFRADALPPVKEVLYIPKASKLEVDKTVFLTNAAKKGRSGAGVLVTDKCLTTSSALSRFEHQNTFAGRRDGSVHPLTDTFGEHNTKRHMRTLGATTSSSAERSLSERGSDCSGRLDSTCEDSGGSSVMPLTLRERRDIAVYESRQKTMQAKELREAGWNTSSALPEERTNVYKLREYKDYRPINKRKEGTMFLRNGSGSCKERGRNSLSETGEEAGGGHIGGTIGLDDNDAPQTIDVVAEQDAAKRRQREAKRLRRGAYTAPIERQIQITEQMRSAKEARLLAEKERKANLDDATSTPSSAEAPQRSKKATTTVRKGTAVGTSEAVFKMSNRDLWWSALPPELEKFRAEISASQKSSISPAQHTDTDSDEG